VGGGAVKKPGECKKGETVSGLKDSANNRLEG